jgi:flagellar hook-length control protein FliK
MKTLPLGVAGLGAKSVLGSDAGQHDDTQNFSAMLQSQPAERQPPPRPRAPAASDTSRDTPRDPPRQDDNSASAARDPAPRPRGNAQPAPRDARATVDRQPSARPAPARAATTPSNQPNSKVAGQPQPTRAKAAGATNQDDEKSGQTTTPPTPDAPWPPAGLGGLEAVLTASAAVAPPPVANTPVPTTPASTALTTAPTAVGVEGAPQASALAAVPPGIQPGNAADPQTPGLAAAAPGVGGADFAPKMAAIKIDPATAKVADAIVAGNEGAPAPAPDAATLLALHTPTSHTNAARSDANVFDASPTPTPHLHEGFDEAVGTRLSWLADQKIGHAHIKISPNDLGPVEVRLQLDGDKVNASFTAAHADVRQALEQSLPRLREMLGQQGFQLGHTDVGGQQPQGRQTASRGDFATNPDAPGLDEVASVGIPAVLRQRGLLDAYA